MYLWLLICIYVNYGTKFMNGFNATAAAFYDAFITI